MIYLTASLVVMSFTFFAMIKAKNELYDFLKKDYEREIKYRIELEKRIIKILEEKL